MQHLLKTCIFFVKNQLKPKYKFTNTHTQEPAQNICFFLHSLLLCYIYLLLEKEQI